MCTNGQIKEIEFYNVDAELRFRTSDGTDKKLDEKETDIIDFMYDKIENRYCEAHKVLKELYETMDNRPKYQRYRMVRRFCRCNFGRADTTQLDIDNSSALRFEKVTCPLRGECKHEGIICRPKLNTTITPSEMRVLELLYKGYNNHKIASELCVAIDTVRKHKANAWAKIDVHSEADFIRWADNRSLFTNH